MPKQRKGEFSVIRQGKGELIRYAFSNIEVRRKEHVFGNLIILLFTQIGVADVLSRYRIFSKYFIKIFSAVPNSFEIEVKEFCIYNLYYANQCPEASFSNFLVYNIYT